jgi:hypothetical protein
MKPINNPITIATVYIVVLMVSAFHLSQRQSPTLEGGRANGVPTPENAFNRLIGTLSSDR